MGIIMRKTYFFIFCIGFLLFANLTSYAQDSQGIDFSIRFFDKKIYYPESDILIKVEIANNSPQTYRFKAANKHQFNIEFDVKTMANERLKSSPEFIMMRNSNQHVFYREVDLEPGEQYSFVVNIKDFIDMTQPGAYYIQGFYFPELSSVRSNKLTSNHLTVSVRPSFGALEVQSIIDEKTGEVLKREKLPPDEVVDYLISARQREQWNKFLLYLDLESLLLQDPAKKRRYLRLSDEARRKELEEFRMLMTQESMDNGEILLLPERYEILQTTYSKNEGRVEVKEWFAYADFTEVKQFTYYLRRENDSWIVYNYETRNIGTE